MIGQCTDVWTHILKHLDYLDYYQLKCTNKTYYQLFKSPLIKSLEVTKCQQYKKQKKYLVIKIVVRALENYFAHVYCNVNNVKFKLFKGEKIVGTYIGNFHYVFKQLYSVFRSQIEITVTLQSDLDLRNCDQYSNFDIEVNNKRCLFFPSDLNQKYKRSPSGTPWPINTEGDKSYLCTKYKIGMEDFVHLLNDYMNKIDQCWIASDKDLSQLKLHPWLLPSIFYSGPETSPDNDQFTLIKIKCNGII